MDNYEYQLAGVPYTDVAISPNNSMIVTAVGKGVEILTNDTTEGKKLIKHDANVVGVFFQNDSVLVTVTETGEISEFDVADGNQELKNNRRVTAFPVVCAFAQKLKIGEEEKEMKLWLLVKTNESTKKKVYDVCVVCANSSLEKVHQVPDSVNKHQISIEGNILAYCFDHEVHAIQLNEERKVEKETVYQWKNSNNHEDEEIYKFVRLATNGSHLVVSMANGRVLQWSNIKTAGVSDTFQVTHWHKVAPQLALTQFGNILSAGAECVLARHTKGQKEPTFLPRLVAPVTLLALSPDSSVVVLVMDDSSVHTVLLSTMAILASYSTMEYCTRSLNSVFKADPALKKLVVLNSKPGNVQWVNPVVGKTDRTMHVTLENVVDGDMSLVGIKPSFRDVMESAFAVKYAGTIERFVNFDSENHLRFWKRQSDPSKMMLIATVSAQKDVVFITSCQSESAQFDKTFVTASTSGTISVWEFTQNEQDVREDIERSRNWQDASINAISSIQTDGKFASAHGKHVVLWNVKNMKILDVLSCEEEVISMEFSSNRYLIISTKKGVVCWDTLCLLVLWRINQRVGIFVSWAGCFAFDKDQVMRFEAETGRVLSTVRFSSTINQLVVVTPKPNTYAYMAKTDDGIMCIRPATISTKSRGARKSTKTPFQELGKSTPITPTTQQDQQFVRQPKPDSARLFAGPVHSLSPISFIAPLFIEKCLLPRN